MLANPTIDARWRCSPRGALMAALDFRGQTVWVTGAGKGIGYATALAFVEAGANVTGFDLA